MLSQSIEALLNKQINHELNAAYHYLAMRAWFETANLSGFTRWMSQQAQEEVEHAMKIFKFVCDRGGTVSLEAIAKPTTGYNAPQEVFTRAAELERVNTKSIHELYAAALNERDYATQSFL